MQRARTQTKHHYICKYNKFFLYSAKGKKFRSEGSFLGSNQLLMMIRMLGYITEFSQRPCYDWSTESTVLKVFSSRSVLKIPVSCSSRVWRSLFLNWEQCSSFSGIKCGFTFGGAVDFLVFLWVEATSIVGRITLNCGGGSLDCGSFVRVPSSSGLVGGGHFPGFRGTPAGLRFLATVILCNSGFKDWRFCSIATK